MFRSLMAISLGGSLGIVFTVFISVIYGEGAVIDFIPTLGLITLSLVFICLAMERSNAWAVNTIIVSGAFLIASMTLDFFMLLGP